MVNPFQKIFPKKHVYEFKTSSFENQLAAESANYATTAATTTAATTSTTTIIGATAASAALVVVAVVVITTAVVLTQPKSDQNISTTTPTTTTTTTTTTATTTTTTTRLILSYNGSCANTINICNSQLGLSCKNGFCLCNEDSYFDNTTCSNIFKIYLNY